MLIALPGRYVTSLHGADDGLDHARDVDEHEAGTNWCGGATPTSDRGHHGRSPTWMK